jgi:EAL domain-containing protein (putative c-di-GMP-specific phosphodiesterase class I)
MRKALDEGQFQLFYQPLVGARCNRIVALEALLRWNDPDGEAVGPDLFIPIAEETGLIDRIGLFVLERACQEAAAWPDLQLAVNVSAAQLRNPDFPLHLAEILQKTGFPARRLELEITETYVVLQPEIANRVLSQIQRLGVKIALDDFGTGYASIGFLRQFNFDTLKIDRSLVVDAISDDGARAMVHASIVVARALGMAVVAEGIENEAQAHFMRVAGCDTLQGWLYAPAVAAGEVYDLVNSFADGDWTEAQSPARKMAAS